MKRSQFALLLWSLMILLEPSGIRCSESICRCVVSNSRYATPAAMPTTTPTIGTTANPREISTATGGLAATTAHPKTETTLIRMNISSVLTAAFTELAFHQSTPGFEFENSTNRFTVPANGSATPMAVIDLLIGPNGGLCRSMPQMEQICVSSACASCNLLQYGSAAATTLEGGSAFSQRIVYEATINRSTDCVDRGAFERFGDFRYLVFIAKGTPPDPNKPFSFTVSITGNFSTYNCPTSGRRRRDIANIDVDSFLQTVSRSSRSAPSECVCPQGQDPVFVSSRTVLIYWTFPLKPFSNDLKDSSSAEYMVLAQESYYLLVDSVRKSTSNLTSVIGDFFDISFAAADSGTKLSGRLAVRNDPQFSNDFLLAQLKLISASWSISNLKVTSPESSNSGSNSSLPVYAVVLISLLCLVVFATGLILVLWQLRVIRRPPPRQLAYKTSEDVNGERRGSEVNTDEAIDISKWRLGATLDGAVQMPETAYQAYSNDSAMPPACGAPTDTHVPATPEYSNFARAANDERAV